MSRLILGIFFILFGAILGIYTGFVWGLIGGITQILDTIRTWPVYDSVKLGWGIGRVLIAGPAGWLAFWLPAALGFGILGVEAPTSRRR